MKCEPKTHNSGFKNSNVRFETKSSGSNNPPFTKSVSGYKRSNTTQRASAFKLTVGKCIFCVDATYEHVSKSCRLNLGNKKSSLCKQGICYVCLKRGRHVAKMCLSRIKCEKYSGKYNTLICYKQNSESPTTDELTRKGQTESSPTSKHISEINTTENVNSILPYKCSVQNPLKRMKYPYKHALH